MTNHARLAPSAAHRWFECPASIRASEGIPDTSSIYADEGSAAHELAQHLLTTGFDADRYLDHYVNLDKKENCAKFSTLQVGGRSFLVTEEMADGIQEYLDFVRNLKNAKFVEWQSEQFVDLTWMGVDGLDGGTADFACYHTRDLILDIVDLKYGKGIAVEPEDNVQLLSYALGVARRYSNRGLVKLRLTVVQPRAPHPAGSIRTWDADVLSILDFEDELRKRALATMEPDAPFVPGEHCRFCKASPTCSARASHVLGLAQAEFDALGQLELIPAATMSQDRMAVVLRHANQIEDWCRSVQEFAHNAAIHGRMPTGFKLVAKRATRKWKTEDEAVTTLWMLGLGDDDIYTRKLKSPAQIEPLLPGKNKKQRAAAIEQNVSKESSGTVLAPNEDPRPAVQADANEFEFVE